VTEQAELPGVTPPGRGRQRLDAVLAELGLNLPRCPRCHRTDYALEYEPVPFGPGEHPMDYGRRWKRTGYRICRCGARWPINPQGAKP